METLVRVPSVLERGTQIIDISHAFIGILVVQRCIELTCPKITLLGISIIYLIKKILLKTEIVG